MTALSQVLQASQHILTEDGQHAHVKATHKVLVECN